MPSYYDNPIFPPSLPGWIVYLTMPVFNDTDGIIKAGEFVRQTEPIADKNGGVVIHKTDEPLSAIGMAMEDMPSKSGGEAIIHARFNIVGNGLKSASHSAN